eukprot:8288858-Pyramimonas_sp.AAC.1
MQERRPRGSLSCQAPQKLQQMAGQKKSPKRRRCAAALHGHRPLGESPPCTDTPCRPGPRGT